MCRYVSTEILYIHGPIMSCMCYFQAFQLCSAWGYVQRQLTFSQSVCAWWQVSRLCWVSVLQCWLHQDSQQRAQQWHQCHHLECDLRRCSSKVRPLSSPSVHIKVVIEAPSVGNPGLAGKWNLQGENRGLDRIWVMKSWHACWLPRRLVLVFTPGFNTPLIIKLFLLRGFLSDSDDCICIQPHSRSWTFYRLRQGLSAVIFSSHFKDIIEKMNMLNMKISNHVQ